jgi:N-acetylmuramoyl-L-alanine amidase
MRRLLPGTSLCVCAALATVLTALLLSLPAAPALGDPVDFGEAGARMRVYWLNGRLMVGVYPLANEGYIQLARRVMADPDAYAAIEALNRKQPVMTGRPVVFPIATLKTELWAQALHALYPEDELTDRGWAHTVTDPLESLIALSEAYTGSQGRFRELARYNRLRDPDVLRIGDEIVVPLRWIPDELGFRPQRLAAPLALDKDAKSGQLYAAYTVAQDDTLYSLLLRFTDRERADELNRMSGLLLKLNGLRDEERLPVGRRLRIPLEWISEEFRGGAVPSVARLEPPRPAPPKRTAPTAPTTPPAHPLRRARPPRPGKAFEPMHVIIDPGHGGADPGAVYGRRGAHDHVIEHEVAYDVAQRLAALLQPRGFEVHLTVNDPKHQYPMARLSTAALGAEQVRVNPPYRMASARVAVNMRVFLVNALYRQLTERQGVAPEHVVLVSIHGDALAPTLRGAMVYYPDHRLRRREFSPHGRVYSLRREAVPSQILFHPADNRSAEDSSRGFGEQVVQSLRALHLGVSPRKPVRSYYYRDGERTLPGVLRYSPVPTSVLVEVANLNNRADRLAMLDADSRQRVAQALAAALDALRAERSAPTVARKAS